MIENRTGISPLGRQPVSEVCWVADNLNFLNGAGWDVHPETARSSGLSARKGDHAPTRAATVKERSSLAMTDSLTVAAPTGLAPYANPFS